MKRRMLSFNRHYTMELNENNNGVSMKTGEDGGGTATALVSSAFNNKLRLFIFFLSFYTLVMYTSIGSADASGPNVCYLLKMPPNPKDRDLALLEAINTTWRSKLQSNDFFYDVIERLGGETKLDGSILKIAVDQIGYEFLHRKVLKTFQFLAQEPSEFAHCDFYFWLDTDSYVNPRALRHTILDKLNPDSFFWTGPTGWQSKCGTFAHSTQLVSKGFLAKTKTWWPLCMEEMERHQNYTSFEDVAFSCCMKKFGINELNLTRGFVDRNNWTVFDDVSSIRHIEPHCVVYAHKVNFSTPATSAVLNSNKVFDCPLQLGDLW